mmetsp:Transcript_56509/g.160217  ORF Transcript_56509/g.160217 Transcript_56509/m.160217 type:complete len:279 (-) Transcript_56509:682-1518(-)
MPDGRGLSKVGVDRLHGRLPSLALAPEARASREAHACHHAETLGVGLRHITGVQHHFRRRDLHAPRRHRGRLRPQHSHPPAVRSAEAPRLEGSPQLLNICICFSFSLSPRASQLNGRSCSAVSRKVLPVAGEPALRAHPAIFGARPRVLLDRVPGQARGSKGSGGVVRSGRPGGGRGLLKCVLQGVVFAVAVASRLGIRIGVAEHVLFQILHLLVAPRSQCIAQRLCIALGSLLRSGSQAPRALNGDRLPRSCTLVCGLRTVREGHASAIAALRRGGL